MEFICLQTTLIFWIVMCLGWILLKWTAYTWHLYIYIFNTIWELLFFSQNCEMISNTYFPWYPAVSTAMPEFHQMMGDRLRSVEQGADTVAWLALSRVASRTRSGQFFQGDQNKMALNENARKVSSHLCTKARLTDCLRCRSQACSSSPPFGMDSQFCWRDSEFHESAGDFGPSRSVTIWCRPSVSSELHQTSVCLDYVI